jgi:2'-5' RNA ligase
VAQPTFFTAPGRDRGPEPLILTAQADEAAARRFDAWRRAHYPAHLNRVPAHITLFHRLPPDDLEAIEERLSERCWELAPLGARAVGLVSTGRGIAIVLDAPALVRLRTELARAWSRWLSPQDRQRLEPHVTIQNKVPPSKARQTLQALEPLFEPFSFTVEALRLWRYKGGPWEHVARFPLGGAPE